MNNPWGVGEGEPLWPMGSSILARNGKKWSGGVKMAFSGIIGHFLRALLSPPPVFTTSYCATLCQTTPLTALWLNQADSMGGDVRLPCRCYLGNWLQWERIILWQPTALLYCLCFCFWHCNLFLALLPTLQIVSNMENCC